MTSHKTGRTGWIMADRLYPSHGTGAMNQVELVENEDSIEISSLAPHFAVHKFPWRQVFGYVASLVLTAMAFILVINHVLPVTALVSVVIALAVLQAAVQLGVFMHLRESRGMAWQILVLGLGGFIALCVVAGSIWIMMFKSGVA